MWLDISIAISCAVAGLACGWVLHSIGFLGETDLNSLVTLNDSNKVTDERLEQVATGRISEVAGRLHDYATTMAMDVDAHQSRVQAVNNTLQNQGEDGGNEAIYRAVDELIAANDSMQEKLRIAQERIQEQTAQLESAEKMAHTDGLTRIANRRAFDDHLDQQFDTGHKEAGTLAILDVDHFKKFNDTYGHRAGDEVLRTVASILNARLNPYGIAARFGGEEFSIVMNGMTVENAAEIVDHARAAVGERDVHFGDKRLRVRMSAGLAELLPAESKEDWLQRADDALYYSKEHGRDCTHWMDVKTPTRVGIPDAMDSDADRPDSQEIDTATAKSPASETPKAETSTADPANTVIVDADPKLSTSASDAKSDASPSPSTDKATKPSEAKTDADTETASAEPISANPAESSIASETPDDPIQEQKDAAKPSAAEDKMAEVDDLVASVMSDVPDVADGATKDAATATGSSESPGKPTDSKPSENKAADSTASGDKGDSQGTKTKENAGKAGSAKESKPPEEISRRKRPAPDGSGPRAFNYLPDADALEEAMKDLHERSQSANIPLHVMAVRFDRDTGKSTTRALLQIVRATLRSVDRIGCDDDCTLLVCMPNLDANTAMERAQQICHSAEILSDDETDGEEPCNVSIGLADAANDPDFAQVVSRVKLAADMAREDGSNIQFAEVMGNL